MIARRAVSLHAPVMAAVHAAAFPPHSAWSADAVAAQLEGPAVFGFVSEAGCVLARGAADEAEILTLAVVPAARRAGMARSLLRLAHAEAAQRGALKMFLEVAADNIAARQLYAGEGYAQSGLRRHYYGDLDALVLSRALPGGSGGA